MSDKKIIAVVGATGNQGGAVVRALLKDGTFAVRGLTRDTSSRKAQQLVEWGVDVVAANLDDVKTLERAFDGVYGAFFMTNFWEYMDADKEIQQSRNLADAARTARIQH